MGFLNSLRLFLASLVLVTSSYAATVTDVTSWDSSTSTANVFYKNDRSARVMLFSSTVGHSKQGAQRLYFEFDYDFGRDPQPSSSADILTYLDSRRASAPVLSSSIMVFNGQAIKMSGATKKYSDTKNTYVSYTPETTAGHNYVVNLFKKSRSPIKVEFQGDTIYVPVTGFTKVWNSHGGDAI